jgi:hypothetical protein
LFFDWFYPQYFSAIIEGTLNAFYDDDEVVHVCVKFLTEIVNNRNNRVRFDTWNINGLVVFKETAKYVIKLLQVWNSLESKVLKPGGDLYKEKWKFVKEISQLYHNVINGNYINFAICEYYNDDVFTQLTSLTLKMVASLDPVQLQAYAKVEVTVYGMLWCFFSHHMELMFMKFDMALLKSISEMLIRGLSATSFEVQSDSTNCINVFCEFVHEKLRRKPT